MEFDRGPFEEPTPADWRQAVERDLKGADFVRRLVTRTAEGIDVQPLYTAADGPTEPAPAPGQAPYVRGTRPTGGWTIRQEYALAGAERTNQAVREDIERGVEAVGLRLDRAFRLGEPTHATIGVGGLAVAAADDLSRALDGVPLDRVHLALDAGGNTLAGLAMLAAAAERHGVPLAALRATVSGDPLGALAADGALPTSLYGAWDEVAGAIDFAGASAPGIRPWVVSSRAWHRAGADVALDLGLTLSSAVDGLRELGARGVPAGIAAHHVEFQLELGRDMFMEIARLRALRMLWYRVLELCGVGQTAAEMRIHAASSFRALTRRDPWVNMLRGTATTFAAIVGGADSIATTPFDAALGPADRLGRRVARNTQLVLRLESHLDAVADPAGGSWYVESLTERLAQRGWELMQTIEKEGGLGAALAAGTAQERVKAAAAGIEEGIRHRVRPITGVSDYANPGEALPWPTAEDRAAVIAEREASALRAAQLTLADSEPRDVALAIRAAIAGASVEAISRSVHAGRRAEAEPLVARREAEAFERLMEASDAHAARTGDPPAIFLAAVGPAAKHRARATWTTRFFQAGGLRVVDAAASATVDDAIEAFRRSGAPAAVVVTDDETLPTLLPEAVSRLRTAGARWVAVAGRAPRGLDLPVDPDAFVFVGSDVCDVLTTALTALEVLP